MTELGAAEKQTQLNVSGTVFIYACLVLVLVALLAAGGGIVLGITASTAEHIASTQLLETRTELSDCSHRTAQLNGRIQTFEGLLLRPQQTAVDASIRLFLYEQNKPAATTTLEEYSAWIRARK